MEEGIKVALAPEQLGNLWGLPITNTLLMSWAVIIILGILAYIIGRNVKLIPGRFQTLLEWLFGFVYDYIAETLESRDMARKFFPLLLTIFLFIFTANMLEFTPGIGSVGLFHPSTGSISSLQAGSGQVWEFTPLFRSANTDLNVTLALAIISFFVIEVAGILAIGVSKYASKFVTFRSAMGFAVGIIELFSELARLVSFSFRLFGNIFAGEVLILVVAYFVPYFLPVPLMIFEVFVGFIQAAIFSLLTLFFIKIAIAEPAH